MQSIIINLCNDTGTYYQHETYTISHKRYNKWYKKGYYATRERYCKECFDPYPVCKIPFSIGHIQPVCFDDICVVNCICLHNYQTVRGSNLLVKTSPVLVEALNLCIIRACDIANKLGCGMITYNSKELEDRIKNITDRFSVDYHNIELGGVNSYE